MYYYNFPGCMPSNSLTSEGMVDRLETNWKGKGEGKNGPFFMQQNPEGFRV
jgi:hypothetical protein